MFASRVMVWTSALAIGVSKVEALDCPSGFSKSNGKNDISGCGLTKCTAGLGTSEDVGSCSQKCSANDKCNSFTFSPVGGDPNFKDKTVCLLYDASAPNANHPGDQIFCAKVATPAKAAIVAGEADVAQCVGDMITTSAFLSSAGMLIASVHRACKVDEAHCTKQISLMTRAFAKAAAMSNSAAEHCGGVESECGFSVSQAAVEISKASAAATGFFGAYSPKGVALSEEDKPKVENAQSAAREVGEYLEKASKEITDAVAKCERPGHSGGGTPDVTGYCVGKATRAALDLAAAGIQIDGLTWDCPHKIPDDVEVSDSVKRKCASGVFYTLLDSAKSATRLADVADMCAKDAKAKGNAKCSSKVTDFVRAMSRIGVVGTSDDMQKQMPGWGGASQLDDLADALKSAAVDINDAVQECGDGEAEDGACVGDSLSGATHISAAGLVIAQGLVDCDGHSTAADKVSCANDVLKTMSEFAHASMELLEASADCGRGKMYDTLCGAHVSHGFHVLGKAGIFGAKASEFAAQASPVDNEKPDFDGLAVTISKMAKKLAKFTGAMDEADKHCKMIGEPYQSKFDLTSTGARKWLSAGAGQWRKPTQSSWGAFANRLSGLSFAGLFTLLAAVSLTAVFSINKLIKTRRRANQDHLQMRSLRANEDQVSEKVSEEDA